MDGDGAKCRCLGKMGIFARNIPGCFSIVLGSVVAVSVVGTAGVSHAMQDQDGVTRPKFAGRVARAFDFEEMYTNPLPIPRGWIRAQHDPEVPRDRPGFPIWNQASLDYSSPAYSGRGSVYLPTEGGSTSLILRHGELTVFPKADYLISARVRTDGLNHARARMVAVLIDRAGREIEGSEVSTKLVRTRGEWDLVSVFVEGTEPNAAFVRVELQLLQPEQQPRVRHVKPFTVWSQDFEGGVWFDDVVVAQVPMIGLSTGAVGNVVAGDEPPLLTMTVRDLTGDDLSNAVRVFDASGELVDQRGDGADTWSPELPGFGWYRAVYDVMSGGSLVGRKELDFIWQPTRARGDLAGGFGAKRFVPKNSLFALRTTSMDEKLLAAIPELTKGTGVKHLDMRAWDLSSTQEDFAKGSPLITAIDEVIGSGVQLSLSLSEVPMELADQAAIDHDAIFGLLLQHEPIAMPALGPFIDRYGQRVSEWRLGIESIEDDGVKLVGEVDEIAQLMEPYVPGAVVGVPWAMDRPFESSVVSSSMRVVVMDDPSFPADALPDMIGQWAEMGSGPESRLSVVHRALQDSGTESVWSRVGWLGRRAINAWWASKVTNPENEEIEIVLSDPWTIEAGRRGRVMPGPELLVWRTLVDYLGGRGAVEEIDLVPGVRMLLCSGRAESGETADGAIIVWLDEPGLGESKIELPLSTGGVEVVDLFGNVTQVGLSYETALNLPMHRIGVSRTPRIITGVNAELVQFLSSIRITPDRLEATSGIHKHELVMKNPWPLSIRGRVYIVEPGGYSVPEATDIDRSWEIKPRVVDFVVTAGMEERVALDVSYSSSKLAGMKDLVFDVELLADQEYGLMRVARQIELGTDVIDVDVSFRNGQEGTLEVEAVVTNQTQEQMFVEIVAIAPKNPRQESAIGAVDAMGEGKRSFLFGGLTQGDEVMISVRVPGHSVQVNKAITLP